MTHDSSFTACSRDESRSVSRRLSCTLSHAAEMKLTTAQFCPCHRDLIAQMSCLWSLALARIRHTCAPPLVREWLVISCLRLISIHCGQGLPIETKHHPLSHCQPAWQNTLMSLITSPSGRQSADHVPCIITYHMYKSAFISRIAHTQGRYSAPLSMCVLLSDQQPEWESFSVARKLLRHSPLFHATLYAANSLLHSLHMTSCLAVAVSLPRHCEPCQLHACMCTASLAVAS